MTTYFQFADIVGAAILLVMGDDSDSSTDEFGQRKDRLPSAPRPPLSGGSQPLAAPQRVTNVASLAKQLTEPNRVVGPIRPPGGIPLLERAKENLRIQFQYGPL